MATNLETGVALDAGGWSLRSGGLLLRVGSPVLYGTTSRGHKWSLELAAHDSQVQKCQAVVPGRGAVEVDVLCGSTPAAKVRPGLVINWKQVVVPHDAGILMRVQLEVSGEAEPTSSDCDCCVGHIQLGVVELKPLDCSTESSGPVERTAGRFLKRAHRTASKGCTSFLINGWQSFSFAGTICSSDSQPTTALPYFSGAFHTGAAFPLVATMPESMRTFKIGLTSDLFGILLHTKKRNDVRSDSARVASRFFTCVSDESDFDDSTGEGYGMLLGFLSGHASVGGVTTLDSHNDSQVLNALLFEEEQFALHSVGQVIETGWAMIIPIGTSPSKTAAPVHIQALQCYSKYIEELAAHASVPASRAGRGTKSLAAKPTPVGWCSWYCHQTNVSESLMTETISRLGDARARGDVPLELVQLDDGWQSQWGDWTLPHEARFPRGLKPVTDSIKKHGMKEGWLVDCTNSAHRQLQTACRPSRLGAPHSKGHSAEMWLHRPWNMDLRTRCDSSGGHRICSQGCANGGA